MYIRNIYIFLIETSELIYSLCLSDVQVVSQIRLSYKSKCSEKRWFRVEFKRILYINLKILQLHISVPKMRAKCENSTKLILTCSKEIRDFFFIKEINLFLSF